MTQRLSEKITIDLTPDKSIYEKIGHGQHNLHDAIAELIDNSFDARTKEQIEGKESLKIQINAPTDKKMGGSEYAEYIEITDNGTGMSESVAKNCLVIAKTTKEGKLQGRFGLGLKQSCLSIGKKFTISTKQRDSNKRYILHFDNDKFIRESSWKNFEMDIVEDNTEEHGTTITITDFWNPRLVYPNKLTNIRKAFSWTFGPFIKKSPEGNAQLTLNINDKEVEPADLKSACSQDDIHEIAPTTLHAKLPSGEAVQVSGWFGFLTSKGNTQGFSGFLLYRNMRLIKAWEHIGYAYHAETRLIVGELHLDNFPVTIDKKDFNRDSEQWEELAGIKKFIESGQEKIEEPGILYEIMREKLQKHRKKTAKKREIARIEKETRRLEKLRQQEEEELEKGNAAARDQIRSALERSNAKAPSNAPPSHADTPNIAERLSQLQTFVEKGSIKVGGKETRISFSSESAAPNNPPYRILVREGNVSIMINTDSVFAMDIKYDLKVYVKLLLLMGLAEAVVEIKKEEKSKYLHYFNELIRQYTIERAIIDSYDKSSNDIERLDETIQRLKNATAVF